MFVNKIEWVRKFLQSHNRMLHSWVRDAQWQRWLSGKQVKPRFPANLFSKPGDQQPGGGAGWPGSDNEMPGLKDWHLDWGEGRGRRSVSRRSPSEEASCRKIANMRRLLILLLPIAAIAAPDFSSNLTFSFTIAIYITSTTLALHDFSLGKKCSLEKRTEEGDECFLEPECHEECSQAKDEARKTSILRIQKMWGCLDKSIIIWSGRTWLMII